MPNIQRSAINKQLSAIPAVRIPTHVGTRIPLPRTFTLLLVLGVLTASSGCQLGYFLTTDEDKDVKADYGKIGSHKLAVIIWSDQATLDEDPNVRKRLCKAVTYYLKKNLPQGNLVPAEKVEALQERGSKEWEDMSTRELCDRLDCEMLLRIDLLEYTTRAGNTRELRKGRIRATVNLYDGKPDAAREAVYQTEIVADYPPKAAHGVPDLDEGDLLHETIEHFAEMTARKFYDHKESLRGPSDR
jgi:hypothetical protein